MEKEQMRAHSVRVKRSYSDKQLRSPVETLPQDPWGGSVPPPTGKGLLKGLGSQASGPSWPPFLPFS